ncbi:MAG: hypothetical protein WD696_08360 [Bryobacteraceae bacterium]
MEIFRHFEAGPDPFGRLWQVRFKWLQTAISIRHSDTVDVKFLLECEDAREEKVVAMQHAGLLELSRRANRQLTDSWCSRLAALHLKNVVETGEDMEKSLLTVSSGQLAEYNARIQDFVAAH